MASSGDRKYVIDPRTAHPAGEMVSTNINADDVTSGSSGKGTDSGGSNVLTTLDLKEVFDLFDKNHDGRITMDEFASVVNSLKLDITGADIQKMVHIVDTDGNGVIDFQEFLELMQKYNLKLPPRSPDVKMADSFRQMLFRVFDVDENGVIEKQEIIRVMRNLGEDVTDEDINAMLHTADANGDGKIDFNEFTRMLDKLWTEKT